MTPLRELISSPTWWITAAVLAVSLNWVSTFLYNRMAVYFPKLYSKFVFRSEKNRAMREEIIKAIKEHPHVRESYRHLEIRHRLQGVIYLLLAVMTYCVMSFRFNLKFILKNANAFDRIIGFPGFMVISIILIFLSYAATHAAWKINQLLNEADGTVQYFP